MDLRLYAAVLWRHRVLVGCGLVVVLILALLSFVRVSKDGFAYRKAEIWSNESILGLTQESFPEGRSVLPPTDSPDRFAGLVDQYAALATSDDVIRSLRRQGLLRAPQGGVSKEPPITAAVVPSTVTGAPTPMLKISAAGATPQAATRLAVATMNTFIRYVEARQVAAGIPKAQRIELRPVTQAGVPKLVGPRSKTTPIIVFLAGLTLVVAAAFIRDNFQRAERRPRAEHRPDALPGPRGSVTDAVERPRAFDLRAGPNVEDDETSDDSESVTHTRWSSHSSG